MPGLPIDAAIQQSASAKKRQLRAKLAAQPPNGIRSAFREVEKIYLSRNPPPDYSSVIDLHSSQSRPGVNVHQCQPDFRGSITQESIDCGISPSCEIFTLLDHPGLFIIPRAISPRDQRGLIKNCLRKTTKKPNVNNLDTHYVLPDKGLWYHYEQSRQSANHKDIMVQTVAGTNSHRIVEDKSACSRKLITDPAVTIETPIDVLKATKEAPVPSDSVKPEPAADLFYKLRWTNLGLMYHWTSKSYKLEEVFDRGPQTIIPVPADLASLALIVLSAVPPELIPPNEDWSNFRPESGIVNFYQLKNTLMGHVDQSELVENKPLVSLSFGHSAVFLIGGTTRDDKPTAIYLHSGDALIMSGSCRRAYHGVPRVVKNTLPNYLCDMDQWSEDDRADASIEDRNDWHIFSDYLRTTRINVNIRQVFPEGYLDDLGLTNDRKSAI